MTYNIPDQKERLRALDPHTSFIVQAPAGSGKTELLTQRFLVLLGRVKQPEEILAITFTKKSAAEMRERIINSLQKASMAAEPSSEHEKTTWQLALNVLACDKKYQWNLLANPNQLRIQTIDSFNSSLTKYLPILSHFGAVPEIVDDATPLYRQAIQEFLSHLEEDVAWSEDIATLLIHLDNDLGKVESLLMNLLSKREQWLPNLAMYAGDASLRHTLEQNLSLVVSDILSSLEQTLPKNLLDELLVLVDYAAANGAAVIGGFRDLKVSLTSQLDHSVYWLALANFLLTNENEWRKRFDKNLGFPPATQFKNPQEKNAAKELKEKMLALIQKLAAENNLKKYLIELKHAPDTHYSETQWKVLQALLRVLQVAVAQLKITFQQHGKIDFIENALAALIALGTEDQPTDLTLALDYQIRHILIDEFQDTSNIQYRLLAKLTAEWQSGDGRTLFLVGDPMQSIYRFREAEVGLFIRARKKGIGNIHLEPLTLSVNFRSTTSVVSWVNDHFGAIFPDYEDISSGAVTYSPSVSPKTTNELYDAVTLHPCVNQHKKAQAEKIVELIKTQKKNDPSSTIAILVRSRSHLSTIIPALKEAQLAFRAIDIDPLIERPIIQDLISLTRAMIHPGDRVAWLAILRAPWCGLTLGDLLNLAGDYRNKCIFEQLQDKKIIKTLSLDGQQRLERILPILKTKMFERRRLSLRSWIESAWILLGGPACTTIPQDLEDAAVYFKLLEKLDQGGDLLNLNHLQEKVNKLYSSPNHLADNSLQIMTIHNAKGLEFDTVILPQLDRKTSGDDKQLLLWIEQTRSKKTNTLILAPIAAANDKTDTIYDYVKKQQAYKLDFENTRLLYVAATRAKKYLHLLFNINSDDEDSLNNPVGKSLLDKLWPVIKNKIAIQADAKKSEAENTQVSLPMSLKRFPANWQNPISENTKVDNLTFHQKSAGFFLPNNRLKYCGILIHTLLQQISHLGTTWWQSADIKQRQKYCRFQLIQLGMDETDITDSITTIFNAINKTLADPRGQWILHPHQEANSEYRVTAIVNNLPKQFIIDRTFIDENNIRWIIDYKTAHSDDDVLTDFLQSEQDKYQAQMEQYYFAMKHLDNRPIRMGLYFPLSGGWTEWAPPL